MFSLLIFYVFYVYFFFFIDAFFFVFEQSVRLAEALKKAGVEVQLVAIKGMDHGPTTPEQQDELMKALGKALEFFDKHLKR